MNAMYLPLLYLPLFAMLFANSHSIALYLTQLGGGHLAIRCIIHIYSKMY